MAAPSRSNAALAEPLRPPAPRCPRPALALVRSTLPPELARQVRSGRELIRGAARPRTRDDRRATGVPALDRLLGGGLPRSRLVELVGGRSGGRFSLALAVLATATAGGDAAALVDLGDGLDPAAAATAGVDLARLLWVRPRTVQEALGAGEILLQTGFQWVVVDLGLPPLPGGRGGEAAWLRLARAARPHGAVLLVASPYRATGTAASAVLAAGRGRGAWTGRDRTAPPLLTGLAARLAVDKNRESAATAGDAEPLRLAAVEALATGGTPPWGAVEEEEELGRERAAAWAAAG